MKNRLYPGFSKAIFALLLILSAMPFISPAWSLILGLIFAQLFDHPFAEINHRATNLLLKFSVIALGFGMNIGVALRSGAEGFIFTALSVSGVLIAGKLLRNLFKTDGKISFLIAAGTAICGGSAIAAISPVIKPESRQISAALGTVFILNSAALFIFPGLGHLLHLSQSQFGIWSAIAIHDTSSVVGAASRYGTEALQVATTVKLARTLWIIPVSFIASLLFKGSSRVSIPWFILLFVLAMLAGTYLSVFAKLNPGIQSFARAGLSSALFLIGSGLPLRMVRSVGLRPFAEGLLLWILIALASLWIVCRYF